MSPSDSFPHQLKLGYHITASMRNPGPGVNGLPTELLCDIFRLAIDADTARRDRCRLILVCRRWRESVEGSALLWTDISALDGSDYVRRALRKSKGAMIDLRFPMSSWAKVTLEWFLAEASSQIARWQSLDVEIYSESPPSLRSALSPLTTAQPPSLGSLKLGLFGGFQFRNTITLFSGAPAPPTLKNLTLHLISVAIEPLRLSGLVSLDLTQVETISTPQLLEILRNSPWLETLSLDENPGLVGTGSQPSTVQLIELPKLVSLSFKWSDHVAMNCIISNIRIPNRHRVFIRTVITDVNPGSVLFTPTITHILHTTIPMADLESSTIRVEIAGDVDCVIQFRGMKLAVLVEGEERVHEILGWLADGLGPEAAEFPVHLILDLSEMDPIRLVAVPPPLIVKHLSISDFLSGSLSESLCRAMVLPPDHASSGWFLAEMESISVGFEAVESQRQLVSMLRSRYEATSGPETEFRCPMKLQRFELRGQPRTDGLVEEIRGILGEVDVFWATLTEGLF